MSNKEGGFPYRVAILTSGLLVAGVGVTTGARLVGDQSDQSVYFSDGYAGSLGSGNVGGIISFRILDIYPALFQGDFHAPLISKKERDTYYSGSLTMNSHGLIAFGLVEKQHPSQASTIVYNPKTQAKYTIKDLYNPEFSSDGTLYGTMLSADGRGIARMDKTDTGYIPEVIIPKSYLFLLSPDGKKILTLPEQHNNPTTLSPTITMLENLEQSYSLRDQTYVRLGETVVWQSDSQSVVLLRDDGVGYPYKLVQISPWDSDKNNVIDTPFEVHSLYPHRTNSDEVLLRVAGKQGNNTIQNVVTYNVKTGESQVVIEDVEIVYGWIKDAGRDLLLYRKDFTRPDLYVWNPQTGGKTWYADINNNRLSSVFLLPNED